MFLTGCIRQGSGAFSSRSEPAAPSRRGEPRIVLPHGASEKELGAPDDGSELSRRSDRPKSHAARTHLDRSPIVRKSESDLGRTGARRIGFRRRTILDDQGGIGRFGRARTDWAGWADSGGPGRAGRDRRIRARTDRAGSADSGPDGREGSAIRAGPGDPGFSRRPGRGPTDRAGSRPSRHPRSNPR
jgi:hypothetical protein